MCSTCREEYGRWRHEHFYKIYILDRILQALPTSCEFMKNGCKVIQELSQITFHEENCEFRDVLCIFNFCDVVMPVLCLTDHLKFIHKKDVYSSLDGNVYQNDESNYTVKFIMVKEYFLKHLRWGPYILRYGNKIFLAHLENDPKKEITMVWLQIYGSELESKNYQYRIQIKDSEIGTYMYEGQVNSIDDKKTEVRR